MTARSIELSDALSALVVQQPFYTVLLFDLLELVEGDNLNGCPIKTAATDGRTVMINPAFFKQISVQERMGVIVHEVLHCVFQHPARGETYKQLGVGPDLKPWNHKKMNYAADYIINQMVVDAGMQMPLGSLFNPQITANDVMDEVYVKIPDPPEDDKNWDNHDAGAAPPAQQPDTPTIQRSLKMAAAAQEASGQGNLPAGMKRLIDEICEPKVTWTDYILRTVQNILGNEEYTWRRPNRRRLAVAPHIYWPGRTGNKSGTGVVEVDMSGSVGDTMVTAFFAEMHGIMSQCQPEKMYVGFVDAELYEDTLHEIEDVNDLLDLRQKAGGGGGTDMTVIFKEIEQRGIEPDFVVILTDGHTPFGEDTGIPTIWCITTKDIVAPWGHTVYCPL